MALAVDTPTSLTTAQLAALRAAGVTAVSRYIAPQLWKVCTVAECASYGPAGMQWTLNWESGAQDLKALSPSQTAAYAHQAVAMAQARAYPVGSAIYVSADWNVSAGEWPVVAANLRVIRPIFAAAGYRLGLYAPWDALTWAKRDGLVDFYWQAGMSTSWSGGRNAGAWPGAHLRQRRSTVLAGADCDINDILISAFGQAGAMQPIPTEDDMAFLAQTGGNAAAAPGQYYLCDGYRSVPITPERADLLAYLATEPSGAALQLGRSATGDNAEWTGINGKHGIVRMGWTPAFGPVVADNGGVASVSQDQLNAAVADAVAAAGPGLTAQQVTDAVVAALGHLRLTVAS